MRTDPRPQEALRIALGERYAIDRLLGKGGMGAVYLARDQQLDRPVALKVLLPEFAAQADLRERFLRETRMAASFSHPNIVPVHAVEERDGLLAFAMGYVEGESLAERVARGGPLGVRELVRLMQDVGYALAYAHGRGVVHRDLKPENVMIERATGRALLMDFGISRTIAASSHAPGLTRVGEVVGTPEFMSPEQAAGDDVDGRSDLYALGLVAWFAATGALAISGESTQKVLVKQLTEIVPPVRAHRGDLPPAIADAIDRCTRKEPAERFANAQDLVDALDLARLAAPEVPLPIRLFADEAGLAALVLVGGLAGGALLYLALGRIFEGDLDIILPVVVYAAVVWGRLTQTAEQARRLASRGFGVEEIQRGLAGVLAEHDADRAQLAADASVVARRRRAVMTWLVLLALSFAVRWYVLNFQRVLLKPGWYGVKIPGTILLYIAAVTRGLAYIGLLRSPLRRTFGDWALRLVWLAAPGRWLLRRAVVRGARPSTAPPATTSVVGTSAPSRPAAPSTTLEDRVRRLEDRMQSLEARSR